MSEYGRHTYSGGVYHRSCCGHAPSQGGIRTVCPHVEHQNVRWPAVPVAVAAEQPQTSQPTMHCPPISG